MIGIFNAFPNPTNEKATLDSNVLEAWKEINEQIRHWETLVFENARNLFTVVTLALGATGAVLAWSSVNWNTQRLVMVLFLATGIVVSLSAILVILSTKNYLAGFYRRRKALEASIPQLRLGEPDSPANQKKLLGSGWTLPAVACGFGLAAVLCLTLIVTALTADEPNRSILNGARLPGADLSTVNGLTQRDLVGACGDAATKLPAGLVLQHCGQTANDGSPVAQPKPLPATPEASRKNGP